MNKLLLIEDDTSISDMIVEYLESEQYEIVRAYDGEEGLRKFQEDTYSLILLDLMIPKISGFDVLRKIRTSDLIPVIIITAKDNDTAKVSGLGFGADDYLTKPFSLIELSARIKANIRRVTKYSLEKKEELIYVKDLEINMNTCLVKKMEWIFI